LAQAQKPVFKKIEKAYRISIYDGLPQNSTYAVTKDKKGNLWIGTGDGLVYFDGRKPININSNNKEKIRNVVRQIIPFNTNSLIVNTDHGVFTINEKLNVHKIYLFENQYIKIIENDSLSFVYVDSNKDVFRYYFKEKLARKLKQNIPIETFVEFKNKINDHIFFTLEAAYVFQAKSDSILLTKIKPITNQLVSHAFYYENSFWISSGNSVFEYQESKLINQYTFDTPIYEFQIIDHIQKKTNFEVILNDVKNNKIDYQVIQHLEVFNNELYVHTDGDGLICVAKNYNILQHYIPYIENLPAKFITHIGKDLQANLWIATLNNGVLVTDSLFNVRNYLSKSLHPTFSQIYSVYDSGIDYYLGTNKGIAVLNRNFQVKSFIEGLPVVSFLNNCNDTLHIQSKYTFLKFNLQDNSFLPQNYDSIWLCDKQFYLNKKSIYQPFTKKFYSFSDHIKDFQFIDNQLLVSTKRDLFVFDTSTQSALVYSGYFYEIEHNNETTLITSNNGIWLFRKKNFSHPIILNTYFGTQSLEFNTGCLTHINGNRYLAGGIFGLNDFNANFKIKLPNIAYINEIGDVGNLTKIEKSLKEELVFEVICSDFSAIGLTKIKMRLIGSDTSEFTYNYNQDIRFSNLSPGEYHLQYCLISEYGVTEMILYPKKWIIKPPFYFRIPFVLFISFFVIILIYLVARFYIKLKYKQKLDVLYKEKALNKERLRISKDMHDEIGSNITQIALISEIALRKGDVNHYTETLQKIKQKSSKLIDNISELIWLTKPEHDYWSALSGYLRELLAESCESYAIQLKFIDKLSQIDPEINHLVRRNIYMVVKELSNNTFKYAKASSIEILFDLNENILLFNYADNGIGCNLSTIKNGNGLYNIQERIKELSGAMDIVTAEGAGFNVFIKIPIA
jgi:signal transduction histidine kinase